MCRLNTPKQFQALKYSFSWEVGTFKMKERHKSLFDLTNKISFNKMSTHDGGICKANRKIS